MPSFRRFNSLRSITRLIIAFALGGSTSFAVYIFSNPLFASIMVGWSVFAGLMILFSWLTFLTTSDMDLYMETREEDESGPVIFGLVVLSVCLSLAGIILMRGSVHKLAFVDVALSWILLHTIFALHYARLFYSDQKPVPLVFPNDEEPDYLDFAYFSFVIGMTFQVSDVTTNTKQMRRIVLLHSLISFVFNTVIVALTIGVLASF